MSNYPPGCSGVPDDDWNWCEHECHDEDKNPDASGECCEVCAPKEQEHEEPSFCDIFCVRNSHDPSCPTLKGNKK